MTAATNSQQSKTLDNLVIVGSTGPEIVKLMDERRRMLNERVNVLGFLDDDPKRCGSSFMDLPVLGATDLLQTTYRDAWVINNVAKTTEVRHRVWKRLEAMGSRFHTAIHPSVDQAYVEIGSGTIIQEGVIMGPKAIIGQQCIVSFAGIVAHESVVHDCCFLAPGVVINGRVTVKEGAFLGAGSIIMPNVTVGEWSIVGAGSVVIADVPPRSTVFGSPARVIAQRTPDREVL